MAPAQAETSIRISLKDRYLTLLDDGKEIGKYPVAIGAPESPTREGSYAAWPSWVKLRAAVSLGCIRMLNNDVIQVFNRIKVGTPVLVTKN